MAGIILVTGGNRSGKSGFALDTALTLPGRRIFIATCPKIDEEMDRRILKHKEERRGQGWDTVEEPLDLNGVFLKFSSQEETVTIVDCLSLWINNLMYDAQQKGQTLEESTVVSITSEMLRSVRSGFPGKVIFVSGEVGLGLVPDSALSRSYRDLLGTCNRTLASESDEAFFLVSGIPLRLKPNSGPHQGEYDSSGNF
ncbi:bifunctional adenosylcobinamide kinase/adenosylcobinamide-phosphate guanylyltransferase [Leptospira fletcheri]|uniref:Adenosylcobinamide kinase n=1 Tax=Leptospira fletcheri TaxID=2484981 RepID=A0A4R9GGY8_9LEPT|nr:bifunctional adenosylcobinamide kinase/adenosylcobinamide-phosphate guanylyltransferase [Leptospira fletcheri]TGK11994.1 bifunctional adenosylcobinamide kinase/adenosylcobinamide-phosphate guanylyltransferase [Leptospira fletcheri]